MIIKTIVDEDFVNYRVPSMFIGTALCSGKCCTEAGVPLSVCQNDEWRKTPVKKVMDEYIIDRYSSNDITKAIVFGGLEPFDQFRELNTFIKKLRIDFGIDDDVVIYTGYNKEEVEEYIDELKKYKNIVVKFGRFIPGKVEYHFDSVLGVKLATPNQFAERIS